MNPQPAESATPETDALKTQGIEWVPVGRLERMESRAIAAEAESSEAWAALAWIVEVIIADREIRATPDNQAWINRARDVAKYRLAELAALKSKLAESQAGWQPIASAPKDGTEIVVWREDAGVFTAFYHPSFQEGDDPNCPTGESCWFTPSGEDLTSDIPPLWRPLPPPPEEGR